MKIDLDTKTRDELIEKSYKQIDEINSEISIKRKNVRNVIDNELKGKNLDYNEIIVKNDSAYKKIFLETRTFLTNRLHMLKREKDKLELIKNDPNCIKKINEIDRLISMYEEDYQIMKEAPNEYFKGYMYENWELFITNPKVKREIYNLTKTLCVLQKKRDKVLNTIKLLEEPKPINVKYLGLILNEKKAKDEKSSRKY